MNRLGLLVMIFAIISLLGLVQADARVEAAQEPVPAVAAPAPQPIAHVHVHGVTAGMPWEYNQSGVLVGIASVPTFIHGYVLTSLEWAGREPDLVLHTYNVAWEVNWTTR